MTKNTKDPSDFKPAEYWLGCKIRLAEAEQLYQAGQFGGSLMLAGVAEECAIRSLFPDRAPFDGRHDLRALLRTAAVKPSIQLVRAVELLRLVWRNSYRYMGPDQQTRLLRATGRYSNRLARQVLTEATADAMQAARTIYAHAHALHGRQEKP